MTYFIKYTEDPSMLQLNKIIFIILVLHMALKQLCTLNETPILTARYFEEPRNSEELRGTPRNSEELRETPRNSKELRGTPRNSEELRGTLNSQEFKRTPKEIQGTPKGTPKTHTWITSMV